MARWLTAFLLALVLVLHAPVQAWGRAAEARATAHEVTCCTSVVVKSLACADCDHGLPAHPKCCASMAGLQLFLSSSPVVVPLPQYAWGERPTDLSAAERFSQPTVPPPKA